MALTKQTVFDTITIRFDNSVDIRTKTTVFDDDGSELGFRYLRRVISPTDDISSEPLRIRQICNIARS